MKLLTFRPKFNTDSTPKASKSTFIKLLIVTNINNVSYNNIVTELDLNILFLNYRLSSYGDMQ